MAARRSIACPNCQTERVSKASGRVRIRCAGCGAYYLASSALDPSARPVEPGSAAVDTEPATGSHTEGHGDPPRITGQTLGAPAAPDLPPPAFVASPGRTEPAAIPGPTVEVARPVIRAAREPDRAPEPPPRPDIRSVERSKTAGSRGGRSYYRHALSGPAA